MTSAVDKLHKLYASTAPPIVWARSTGVEVLNELDVFKSGIIGAAGGHSSTHALRQSLIALRRPLPESRVSCPSLVYQLPPLVTISKGHTERV